MKSTLPTVLNFERTSESRNSFDYSTIAGRINI